MNGKILVVAGPTAVGKTEYSIELALRFGGEIVSADSMQIYQFMDVGSAKPSQEELALVKHHLIGQVDPRQPWSVAEYQKAAKACIAEIFNAGKLPLVSGGTGLYVNSLLYDMDFSAMPRQAGFREQLEQEAAEKGPEVLHARLAAADPAAAARIHPNNVKKLIRAIEVAESSGKGIPEFSESLVKTADYDYILVGLCRDREELYQRIDRRVELMMEAGLTEEVKALMDMGLTEADISMKGIGYKEVIGALKGEYSMEDALALVQQSSRRYAKRQMTWFRRYPDITWFNLSEFPSKEAALAGLMAHVEAALQ